MANEITASAALSFLKSPAAKVSMASASQSFDVAGAYSIRNVQLIGTSAEALMLGEVGTPGWFYIKNLDTGNYIEILTGVAGSAFLKLKPGEFALGRFGCAAPAAKANTADCKIEYLIIEN